MVGIGIYQLCVITSFPNYTISNIGEVWSDNINDWLKLRPTRDGYKQVRLTNEFGAYEKKVHRLVAESFIKNPENLPTVDHIDGNKHNNHIDNLQWMSRGDNVRKHHSKSYAVVDPKGNLYVFPCVRPFCREHKLDPSSLFNVIYGKSAQHHGWTKYKGEVQFVV